MASLETIATHLSGLAAEGEAAEAVRLHIMDTLVAAKFGRLLADAGPIHIFSDDGLAPQIALQIAVTRSTEVDDIEILGCVTPGSVVVPSAILAGAMLDADDAMVLRAVMAGYEAMIWFSRAVGGPAALARGIWPTFVAAPLGVAATLASLRGFAPKKLEAALGLALARTALFAGRGAASPRFVLLGLAAAEGLRAYEAAAEGCGADSAVLDHILDLVGGSKDQPAVEQPLIHDCEIKPYSTARQGLAAIEAFRSLQLKPHEIPRVAHILAEMPSATLGFLHNRPPGRMGMIVNLASQLALSTTDAALFDLRRDASLAGELQPIADKVELRGAPDLDALYPGRWSARVTVRFESGELRKAEWSGPLAPTWESLTAKAVKIGSASGFDTSFVSPLTEACRALGKGSRGAKSLAALALR
jgi:2-methylcitrate dehydratase PrpD